MICSKDLTLRLIIFEQDTYFTACIYGPTVTKYLADLNMTTNHRGYSFFKSFGTLFLLAGMLFGGCLPALAQTPPDADGDGILPLRSDVGINGLKANFHWLSDFTYLKDDSLEMDGSSELEIVFRDVRMLMPRVGVGFQVLTSFFVDGPNDGKSFGIGSWGLGPVVRGYPIKTDRFQPYFEASALFGNNMAVSTMANSKEGGDGFRVRLGLRGGLAVRLTNRFGFFIEGGPDWGSSRLFKADARAWQINFGIDVYRFK